MAQDVTRGGRTDEGGNASDVTRGKINREGTPAGPGVLQSDELRNSERMPRLGNEEDMPDNDALGG
jgi:hypothetical protein